MAKLLAAAALIALYSCADATSRGSQDGDIDQSDSPSDDGEGDTQGEADVPVPDAMPSDDGDDGDAADDDTEGGGGGDDIVLCETDDDCEPDTCRPVDDAGEFRVCTTFCDGDLDCPDEWICVPIGHGRDRVFACLHQDFCLDEDGDGYGIGPGCRGPDCDDNDRHTYPGAPELCDGKDNNCDGTVDVDVVGEGDTCDTGLAGVCGVGELQCNNGSMECAQVNFPAEVELCDGLDNTCDGTVDLDEHGQPLSRSCFPGDPEHVGVGICSAGTQLCEGGEWSNYCLNAVLPREERCNGLDDDCDGVVDNAPFDVGTACDTGLTGHCAIGVWVCDEGERACVTNAVDNKVWFLDADRDGFGDPHTRFVGCAPPDDRAWVLNGDDCDDSDPAINPAAAEVCDGIDNNCDGVIDVDAIDKQPFWIDADGDGWGANGEPIYACEQPEGYAPQTGDCDDENPAINPGAEEICDGIDNNCSGTIDDGEEGVMSTWYRDADEDGYGDPNNYIQSCDQPDGYVSNPDDCDDSDPSLTLPTKWYRDADGDGFGDPDDSMMACTRPRGYVHNDLDCDDENRNVHPDAPELCDGIDNNCDGFVDNDPIDIVTWYRDRDGDGFGNPAISIEACDPPDTTGWVPNGLDCNDNNANIHPNAPEVCDGIDNNCDGVIDDDAVDRTLWFIDEDGDGFGTTAQTILACTKPQGYADNPDDCDDGNPAIHPNAVEVCDGVDNNCDGITDLDAVDIIKWYRDADGDGLGDPNNFTYACSQPDGYVSNSDDCNDSDANTTSPRHWYLDYDGDGFGDPTEAVVACSPPPGYVDNPDDCDDKNFYINPNAVEVCDGIDNNCDGQIDEGVTTRYYYDGDGDGYGNPNVYQDVCVRPPGWVRNGDDCDDSDPDIHGKITWYKDADRDGYGVDEWNPLMPTTVQSCPGVKPPDYYFLFVRLWAYADNADDCDDNSKYACPTCGPQVCDGVDNDCSGVRDHGFEPRRRYYREDSEESCGNPNSWVEASCDPNAASTVRYYTTTCGN